ncbi:MAG: cobalamin B12-binding domain-containing protein [Elusimicrobia bacterium]|nr:cobalamin B12-binding domain-containing protein [Elusimicrobiota bacterium]
MAKNLSFCDLTHTGQIVCANTFPLGAAMVAAYAKQELKDKIAVELFKYPKDFAQYLDKTIPGLAAFSAYSWNNDLSHEMARRIKERSPRTVIVFGGENFPGYGGQNSPVAREAQKAYFEKYPAIDFFIFSEAELAFVELYNKLEAVDFDVAKFKAARTVSGNVYYLVDGEVVASPILPRIQNLDIVPSTYENGLSDKFFDGLLTPMVESARGCPYSCTFCTDGHLYSNLTKRFSQERIKWELEYIAKRANVAELIITDLNFGLFKEDLEISHYLAHLQQEYRYPKYLVQATAKNQKDRIIEISNILKGSLAPGASVQSTSPEVLKAIKRTNLPMADLLEVSKTREKDDASSLSEIIMCLPGDSKAHHFKSIFDMIDAGVTLLRNHQFMLLKGTEAESAPSRAKYRMRSAFRAQPRCFGTYELWGKEFSIVEIEEICIANSTMTYEDYQECRYLNLTVEIFLNDAIFYDVFRFAGRYGVSRSAFIKRIHEVVMADGGPVSKLYASFNAEEKGNLWHSREEFAKYLSDPEIVKRYVAGELGSNEIYKHRVLAVFRHMKELHRIVYGVARELLGGKLDSDPIMALYFKELSEFSQLRKTDFLNYEQAERRTFHFDFVALAEKNFTLDPETLHAPEGVEIEVLHSDYQRETIREWIQQHGTDVNGLGRLVSRAQVSQLYRQAKYVRQPVAA